LRDGLDLASPREQHYVAQVLFHLPHPTPFIAGRLLARYVRFIAEVKLDTGETVRAHCVNPGRMEGQVEIGRRVWLSPSQNPKRKLAYTLELIEDVDEKGRVILTGANTQAPNRIIGEALRAKALPGFKRYQTLRAEVKDGESRLDFLLGGSTPHFVEVKNAHLVYPDRRAYFPDSKSERALRHVEHLNAIVQRGDRASVILVVQRGDSLRSVRPSRLHHPEFADACRTAFEAGVGFRAFQVEPTTTGYEVTAALPVDLGLYDPAPQVPWREKGLLHSGWKANPKPK
jgi:sugar fermentation stimulation protein A